MKLSARNQLADVVSKVTLGVVTAEIIVKLEGKKAKPVRRVQRRSRRQAR